MWEEGRDGRTGAKEREFKKYNHKPWIPCLEQNSERPLQVMNRRKPLKVCWLSASLIDDGKGSVRGKVKGNELEDILKKNQHVSRCGHLKRKKKSFEVHTSA